MLERGLVVAEPESRFPVFLEASGIQSKIGINLDKNYQKIHMYDYEKIVEKGSKSALTEKRN